jgi:hypothetical protein
LFTEDTAKKMAKYPETKAVTGTELINKHWNNSDTTLSERVVSFVEDASQKIGLALVSRNKDGHGINKQAMA